MDPNIILLSHALHYTQPKYTSCTHQLYYTISSYVTLCSAIHRNNYSIPINSSHIYYQYSARVHDTQLRGMLTEDISATFSNVVSKQGYFPCV